MTDKNIDVHFSSEDMTWATPQDFFDSLNGIYDFTLDPCCVPATAKCDTYFTPEDDGLEQSWTDHRVFMNPPYGREIKHWVKKAKSEYRNGAQCVVCLVPARVDTGWWNDAVSDMSADVYFIKGRLKFGDAEHSAPFPSALIVWNHYTSGTHHYVNRDLTHVY